MDVEVCRLFARYNRHANKEMNLFIERLDDAQWNREFGGYFKSIKENCNHIYIADFNWLKRFSNLRSFDYIRKPIFERDIAFGTVPLAEVPDYLQKREEMDNLLIEFTNELDNGDLEMQLHYLDSRGEPFTKNFGTLVFHAFNHQTHHRGMVSVYLDMMNIHNDFSNVAPLA